ncbi:carboxyl transferase domain-containing protein, partial [Planctomycetota bacterium]
VEVYERELAAERAQFVRSAARGNPRVRHELGLPVELRKGGHKYRLTVHRVGPCEYRLTTDDGPAQVRLERRGALEAWLSRGELRHRIVTTTSGLDYLIEVNGAPHRVTCEEAGMVRAAAPAVVLSVDVAVGAEVSVGDRLVVLEAMKMEMPVMAPTGGRVREVLVNANEQVNVGAPLLVIEESEALEDASTSPDRVKLGDPSLPSNTAVVAVPAADRCRAALKDLRLFMLGFDFSEDDVAEQLKTYEDLRGEVAPADREIMKREEEILRAFANLSSLFEGQPISGAHRLVAKECLTRFFRAAEDRGEGLPDEFLDCLVRVLKSYDVHDLAPSPRLEEALLWVHKSYLRIDRMAEPALSILERRLELLGSLRPHVEDGFAELLALLLEVPQRRFPGVNMLARRTHFLYFVKPLFEALRSHAYQELEADAGRLAEDPRRDDRHAIVNRLAGSPQPVVGLLSRWLHAEAGGLRQLVCEILVRRFYAERRLATVRTWDVAEASHLTATYRSYDRERRLLAVATSYAGLRRGLTESRLFLEDLPDSVEVSLEYFLSLPADDADHEDTAHHLATLIGEAGLSPRVKRACVTLMSPDRHRAIAYFTFLLERGQAREAREYRGVHAMWADRLDIQGLCDFDTERLESPQDVYLFRAIAKDNPRDERLFAFVDVRHVTEIRSDRGDGLRLPELEWLFLETLTCMQDFQYRRPAHRRLYWNRVLLYVWPQLQVQVEDVSQIVKRLAPATRDLGLEKAVIRVRVPGAGTDVGAEQALHFFFSSGRVVNLRVDDPTTRPVRPLSVYEQRVVRLRARGLHYPYELVRLLAPESADGEALFPPGDFVEYDLDEEGRLVVSERPYGLNEANVVVGVIRSFTLKHPEGMSRVILLSDPSREGGALAEPECRRIVAALDLAADLQVPVEWFPVSAGAKISMESGTENLDWTARVLRRVIEFTRAGGELNLVVAGFNVGAQSYWNAEATMLMHTRGILVMTPAGSMVLTGKRALDHSGGVSAEDNQGIGGADRIMGPNGQAQYLAQDMSEACLILFRYYEHTYVVPGESFPRRATTADPRDRDVTVFPYGGGGGGESFKTVGDLFSAAGNPQRKKPFAVRTVMRAVVDQDHEPLERWAMQQDAEMAVVWDAHVGGIPALVTGIDSRPILRGGGYIPGDGPEVWTGGTLFPLSSKKVARALQAASGNRPAVILANLSGFDGSPESMRKLQLEYGAEIGRAVVEFRGPMVFAVVARYHGGAYVVFSRSLNDNLEIAALEGSYASVIGGAPAAAVVFAREVSKRVYADARIMELQSEVACSAEEKRPKLMARLEAVEREVRAEKQGEIGDQFDRIHSVDRALKVGSLHRIVKPQELRPYLIDALERGMRRFRE